MATRHATMAQFYYLLLSLTRRRLRKSSFGVFKRGKLKQENPEGF
jgi:hypothetical protein